MPIVSASSAIVGGRPRSAVSALDRAREAEAQLLHAPRDVHRPGAVAEVALDLADDRRHGVRRELDAALEVEPLDREDEADRPDLDEVLERLAAAGVPRRDAPHERQVAIDDAIAGALVPGPIGLEQLSELRVGRHRRHPSRR